MSMYAPEGMAPPEFGGGIMGPPIGPQPQQPPEDFVALIKKILDDGRRAATLAPDDKDTLLIEKATSLLAQVLADVQGDNDKALSGTLTPSFARRAG